MADEAYPLPTVTTVTTLTEWESLFAAMAASGVVAGVGSELAPSLNSGARTAVMAAGGALIRGFYKPISSSTGTAIPAASGQNRIDRLVLRLDRAASLAANFIKPTVLTGTPAGTPQPPALTQTTSGLWDLPIARWRALSTGGLDSLVDERWFIGGDTFAFRSTSRPPASPRRFGIETDTGRAVWADGSTWRTDFGPAVASTGVTVASGWSADGTNSARIVSGVVEYTLNMVKSGSTVTQATIDSNGLTVATFPSAFRPAASKYFPVILSGNQFCRMQIQTDGLARIFHVNGDIAAGRVLRLTGMYVL